MNQYTSASTVTPAGTTTFTYDGRGNLKTSGSSTYTYNRLNQMTGGPGATMGYDAAGRLAEYNTSVSTRFVYDGDTMIAEVANPSGAVQRRYVPGPGTDEPIVWFEGSSNTDRRFLQADERGSVVAVSDSAGNKLSINTYDEFGIPGAANTGRFQYTGQAWFPELGLAYYKARWYSPTLGRFMQTDPIGYGDGLNWYNYVGSDPVNATDPNGMRGIFTNVVVPNGFGGCESSCNATNSFPAGGDIVVTANIGGGGVFGGGSSGYGTGPGNFAPDLGGGFGQGPRGGMSQKKPCAGSSGTVYTGVAEFLGNVADATGTAALVLAGAGVVAAPTVVGSAALEGAAAAAGTVSALATGLQVISQFADGDASGGIITALTSLVPGGAGGLASRLLGSAAAASSRAAKGVRLAGQAQGTAAGEIAKNVACGAVQ